jgi:hypothetical protein
VTTDRRPTTVAQRRFAEVAAQLEHLDLADRFIFIHRTTLWAGPESRSGVGSGLSATARLRAELPLLLRRLGVRSLLDVPCGDFHWMSRVNLAGIRYVGADIVDELVRENRRLHEDPTGLRRFVRLDLTADPLPPVDAVLCRDLLVHLSYRRIRRALEGVGRSGARFLLATTFPGVRANRDIEDGDWRPLNLELPPFDFPPPDDAVLEECAEEGGAYADKTLAAWSVRPIRTCWPSPPAGA